MSDVSVEDGSTTSDGSSEGSGSGIHVNQTVNQAQAQSEAQQQQQQQAPVPVFVTPVGGQSQFQGVLIPSASHTQASALLAQIQGLLGL